MTTITHLEWPPEIEEIIHNNNVMRMAPGERSWECPNCGGQGVMTAYRIDAGPFKSPQGRGSKWLEVAGESGWWKGELIVGHCPVCQQGRLQEYLRSICGLEGDELQVSLEDFRTDGNLAAKTEALQLVRSIMAQNRTPAGFVTILGDRETSHGVGKSHLAKSLINGFRRIGIWSRYTTLTDLTAELHAKFGKEEMIRTEDLVETYQTIRVLAIDEIDKAELNGWDRNTFFRLINARHEHAGELLTILIANAYVEEQRLWIWTYDKWGNQTVEAWPAELGYLQSRILGGITITVPGPDYRNYQGFARMQELLPQPEAQEE